jgi:diguanylate cyclase (GGDEF)-like protein
VLVAFARAAQSVLDDDDQFGRYGGEEWLFVLNTVDKKSVQATFDSIANALTNYCSEIEDLKNTETITFSAGAAISTSSNRSLEKLIIHADELLYKAKQSGRNQVNVEQP